MMSSEDKQVLAMIVNAVCETIQEVGGRAPASAIYMALQEKGMSHSQCDSLINGMIAGGMIQRHNHELILEVKP